MTRGSPRVLTGDSPVGTNRFEPRWIATREVQGALQVEEAELRADFEGRKSQEKCALAGQRSLLK